MVFYYYRRRPLQRFQRARSRVYCRFYSKEKYFRPIAKTQFVDSVTTVLKLSHDEYKVMHSLTFEQHQNRVSTLFLTDWVSSVF